MRYLLTGALALFVCLGASAADTESKDTPAAATMRKKLKQKVTIDFQDTRLADAIDEMKDQVKGLRILIDSKGGVSRNQTVTYKGKDVPLEKALDEMFKKNNLGYVVISQRGNAYDGSIMIRQGKERGYPLKKE